MNKLVKIIVALLFIINLIPCFAQQSKPMGPTSRDYIINDFDIDTLANRIYAGGDFPSYDGDTQYRNNLVALDATTGAVLNWDPFTNYYKKVNALVCHNGKIYIAGAPAQASSYVEVYNAAGALVSNFTSSFKTITAVTSMAAIGNKLYVLGTFTDNANVVFNTAVLDDATGSLIRVDQAFEKFSAKKIIGTTDKLFLLQDEFLRVFDRATYALLNEINVGNYGIASDFVIVDDTAYVTGDMGFNGKNEQGCLKFDVSKAVPMNWAFGYNHTCTLNDTLYKASCDAYAPYANLVSTIAKNGNDIYVGGQIGYAGSNGNCISSRSPFRVDRNHSDTFWPAEVKQVFENVDWLVRKYKIWNERLYYIKKNEACTGFTQSDLALTDKIGSYCLKPAAPGAFINPISNPCIGQDYVFEVKELAPNQKYVWTCDVVGAKITPNGNKATINFPYFKFENNVYVSIVNSCGLKSETVFTSLFGTVNPPAVTVSGEDKTLSCIKTSFLMKATSNESPINYLWTYPDGSQSTTQEINVTKPGAYVIKILNTNTGCYKSDNIVVNLDTIKPVIKNPLAYTITSCKPFEVTATGVSDNNTDEIKWSGNGVVNTNPVVFKATGNYTEEIKRAKSGCVTTAIVKVTSTTPKPSIILPSTAHEVNGDIIMDTLTCIKTSTLMNFTSDVSNYQIDIKRPIPLNDIIPNNSTVNTSGI